MEHSAEIFKLIENLSASRWWLLCICSAASLTVSLSASKARAFDPTTVASGLTSLAGIGGGGGGLDEAINVGFALGDLLTDLDVEQSSQDDVSKAVTKLEDLSSKVQGLRDAKSEIDSAINGDLSKAKSLSAKLNAIKNMISASRKIAEIMGMRPRAGTVAATVQQIKINEMILDELQSMRRQQDLKVMDERKIGYQRDYLLESIAETERSKN